MLTALGYGTFGRYDIEQRVGGNPSQNTGVDYAEPGLGVRAVADRHGQSRGHRQAARRAGRGHPGHAPTRRPGTSSPRRGTPTGDVRHPTLTMHTKADPLVLVQNEDVFAREVAANPKADGDLVQVYTVPPNDLPRGRRARPTAPATATSPMCPGSP